MSSAVIQRMFGRSAACSPTHNPNRDKKMRMWSLYAREQVNAILECSCHGTSNKRQFLARDDQPHCTHIIVCFGHNGFRQGAGGGAEGFSAYGAAGVAEVLF